MNPKQPQLDAFENLLKIMDTLRENCPWDKKQTLQSLRTYTIEETYELSDAILDNNSIEIKKELGDLLLHIVFYARIGSETNDFDIKSVCDALCQKLIHRHPHIYSTTEAKTADEVQQNWEKLKLKEGNKSVLGGVPTGLPALIKASRIQEKARSVGFDWDNETQVWNKVQEELQEFKAEVNANNQTDMENEFGDLLFSLINYARFKNINPEDALERTNKKFIQRFQYLESKAETLGKNLSDMTLAEMDIFWNEAKQQ